MLPAASTMELDVDSARRHHPEEQDQPERLELQLSEEDHESEEAVASIRLPQLESQGNSTKPDITEDAIMTGASTSELHLSQLLKSILSRFQYILENDGWAKKQWGIALPLYGSFLKLSIWKRKIGYQDGVLDQVEEGESFRDLTNSTNAHLCTIRNQLDQFKIRYTAAQNLDDIDLYLDAHDILKTLQASLDTLDAKWMSSHPLPTRNTIHNVLVALQDQSPYLN